MGGVPLEVLRELTRLRESEASLRCEIEWLRALYAPSTAFPAAWRLTETEDRLLAALLACKSFLSKDALHHALSGDETDTDAKLVDVYVHKVRRKLQSITGDPIETVWGRGYGLTKPARAAINATLAGGENAVALEGLMAFERIVVGLKKPKRLASIRLADKNGTLRPRCLISLRKEFCDRFGFKSDEAFEVQLGTGEHEGRMRFARAAAGVAIRFSPKGGGTLALGHVPALGETAIDKTPIDVTLIDDDTFEIVLPDAAGEAAPRVTNLHMTDLTLVLGKSRIAKLTAAAQEAGEQVEQYAARFFAAVIDEDDGANRKAA